MAQFNFGWVNRGRDPKIYPGGTDIDLSHGERNACICAYMQRPAGLYHIKCNACGTDVLVNLAGQGRVKLACKDEWASELYGQA